MVISGLLVNIDPGKLEQVKEGIQSIDGLSISDVIKDRIVVILESETVEEEVAASKRIAMMSGVASVKVVYHHFETQSGES